MWRVYLGIILYLSGDTHLRIKDVKSKLEIIVQMTDHEDKKQVDTDTKTVDSTDQDTVKRMDPENILDTEIVVFSYITQDNEPGTLIVNMNSNPRLEVFFERSDLLTMENVKKKKMTLRDLLLNGVVSVGSVDTMETLEISIPDKRVSTQKPSITGKFMHGSRKRLIAEPLGIEFDYYPESDHENTDFDIDDNDDDNENGEENKLPKEKQTASIDVDWLRGE
ncbi:hypothetical protein YASMINEVIRUS_303 [Yasminevirus sp. GU-2018]|uniref:Uncharacterized protein n=1 Tax=Yasminevirus sp. GU-2018 TaxID=2420051 RepID=A0A5K0U7S8_9VIRU|nr:hypothetical protein YASMINEVIRUS_303 [Yasminevirus sp. GU-2018]